MQTFDFAFTVRAPLSAVAEMHHDTHALQWLTPPPVRAQMHAIEPLAEGSIADFTLWFLVLPVRWKARHVNVDPEHGFTDIQISGPMKQWVHTHTFSREGAGITRITEHIEYEHFPGVRGLLSRLLFTHFGLWMTFCYRRFVTRRLLEKTTTRTANAERVGEKHV